MNGYEEHLRDQPDTIADLDRGEATWDGYKYDNEFEPRLLWWTKIHYNPTIHINGMYCRPNNLGDNNDEIVWRDFWDGICP